MEIKIKPFHKNSYPRRGLLIKGSDPSKWLTYVYKMKLDPERAVMYALPGKVANELYGCLVLPEDGIRIEDTGRNSYMQCINNRLFVPENTIVYPELNDAEWAKLFTAPAYIMHQDIGFAELGEEIDWNKLLEVPRETPSQVTVPSKGVYIPNTIRSLSIEADEEKLAEDVEKQVGLGTENLPFKLEKIMKGNHSEIDKLLKYLEQNPEAALTMGIPLDVMGSSRGGGGGRLTFGKTGINIFKPNSDGRILLYIFIGIALVIFLLATLSNGHSGPSGFFFFITFLVSRYIYSMLNSDSESSSGRAAVIADDKYAALKGKYEKLAKDLVLKKEYHKAAGVYLKLLKNNVRAAQVLEEGGYYGEAGAIYLKYCKNKIAAANCFEKGKLYSKAIDIYKQLEQTEKVGDLYLLLNREDEAGRFYKMVAEDYVFKKQYVKASLIYRKKMNQPLQAQALLLEGWHKNFDAFNCLNNYFANINNVDILIAEIRRFYINELEEKRKEAFLKVIKVEFNKYEVLGAPIKDIAYEIIADCIKTNPLIASELTAFNPKDKSLTKDILKFKAAEMNRNRDK